MYLRYPGSFTRVLEESTSNIINNTDYAFKLTKYDNTTGNLYYNTTYESIDGVPATIQPRGRIYFKADANIFVGPSGYAVYETKIDNTTVYIDFQWDVPKYSAENYFFAYVTPPGKIRIDLQDVTRDYDSSVTTVAQPYNSTREVYDITIDDTEEKNNINTISPPGSYVGVNFIINKI